MGFGSKQENEVAAQLRLQTLDLISSPVLGPDVHLEIEPQTTVLVGKNGAGKSAIFERIDEAFRACWGVARPAMDPESLACEFVLEPQSASIQYECSWQTTDESIPEGVDVEILMPRVTEACHMRLPGTTTLLWQVKDGLLIRNDGTKSEFAPGRTLLNTLISMRQSLVVPAMAGPLLVWFSSVSRVAAGVPRDARGRQEIVLEIAPRRHPRKRSSSRLDHLVTRLQTWKEALPEHFEELTQLGRRTQLFDTLEVHYATQVSDRGDSRRFFSVTVDGVDVGLLSDGTARALEILASLVDTDTRLLLIAEPESAAHPGLLARLLDEISAYSTTKQILLATQSPQVVSWATPESLRIVSRVHGKTSVCSLGEETLNRVHWYLHDEDALGDFVYGGGLDNQWKGRISEHVPAHDRQTTRTAHDSLPPREEHADVLDQDNTKYADLWTDRCSTRPCRQVGRSQTTISAIVSRR